MKVIDFKSARCRHCYKCIRNCGVKAIYVKNEQAHIMSEQCIYCGHCLEICPQNAKVYSGDEALVKSFVAGRYKTVVSLAPSYLGVLDYEKPGQIAAALKRLGFDEVRETAEGAAYVTAEYQKLLRQGTMKNIITTCCPSANDLIEKYYPSLVPMMAPVVSPMVAHGRLIKKLYGPDTKVVFAGPCIAKKAEAEGDSRVAGAIDAILTFEELTAWWKEEGVEVRTLEPEPFGNPDPRVNRLYPVSGGVITSVLENSAEDGYYKQHVDGLKACMELFEELEKGEISGCFFEVNVCEDGCIKGPASAGWSRTAVKARRSVVQNVPRTDTPGHFGTNTPDLKKIFHSRSVAAPEPGEEELKKVLHSMGKFSPEDELNCGACGYSGCREKAKAVLAGKAEISMCLPHALENAQSMANLIMDVTPSMILLVNRDMRILECNKKAQELLDVSRQEALTRYVFEFLDETDIACALRDRQEVHNKKISLEYKNVTLSESVIYIERLDAALVIFQDITREEQLALKRYEMKMNMLETAQKVIDKQMTVAQEIAGLLGETTAETKVTLTKLRDSILFEEEEP